MLTKSFFDAIRTDLYGRPMVQSEVDGWNRLGDACAGARANRESTAYILATAYHETGGRMQPVRENLNYSIDRLKKVFGRRVAGRESELAGNPVATANVVYANRLGNGDEASGDGWKFRGRGDVQLTGRANYRKFAETLGVDLEKNPDKALDPGLSAQILVEGMLQGMFTGTRLDDVSEAATGRLDFKDDREIVNGTDRAELIAKYAMTIYEALEGVDMLSQSRTVQATKAVRKSSDLGAIISATTAVITGAGQMLTDHTDDVIATAQSGVTLATILGWAPPIVALVLVVLFLINRVQANKAEDARREDNEVRGV